MNIIDLKNILQATGYPVAYSHFTESENNPVPPPPFICYLITYSSNFNADNISFHEIQNVQIELYTNDKDLAAESRLETVLNENEIPFATTETYIESESLYQKIYEMRLI